MQKHLMNKTTTQSIVTRFAPSPTGPFHIGSARTALFNYTLARKNAGRFIMRIEDTDVERSQKVYEKQIIEGMDWLGLEYDKIFHQSERKQNAIYTPYIRALLETEKAYFSNEGGRERVIRFKNTNETITFNDGVRGSISVNTEELGDFVIARDIDSPLYHLALIIDDAEMGVTHILRGDDHIYNTPRQIVLMNALDITPPEYVHIPLILSEDRSKLSKRRKKDGDATIATLREHGYLPEAIINFLGLLGWSPGTEKSNDIFSLEEFIDMFSLSGIQVSGAIFDEAKLKWINREHIKQASPDRLYQLVVSFIPKYYRKKTNGETILRKLLPLILERIEVFKEVETMFEEGEFDYFFEKPTYPTENLLPKEDSSPAVVKEHIDKILQILRKIPSNSFLKEGIKEALWDYASEKGRGEVLWPMRYALSGKKKSPDVFTIAEVVGKEQTIIRLEEAAKKLSALQIDQ